LKNVGAEIPIENDIAVLQKWRTPSSQSVFVLRAFGSISIVDHSAQQLPIQTVLDMISVSLQMLWGVALNTAATERT